MKIIKYFVKRLETVRVELWAMRQWEGEDLWSITQETQTAMVNMISKRILYQLDFSKTNRKIKKTKMDIYNEIVNKDKDR